MVNDIDLLNGLIDRTRQSQEYIWRCQLIISKFATRYVAQIPFTLLIMLMMLIWYSEYFN